MLIHSYVNKLSRNYFLKYFCSITPKKATIMYSKSTNIVYNLTTEEFFYEHQNIDTPVLLFYQNDRNVVFGKHQNPWKECNLNLMEQDNVNLARRRSGGGAVYQDLGNVCFSFFLPQQIKNDFKEINTKILINSFKSLSINAEQTGRNDISVEGRKISGSAFKINMGSKKFNAKTLHHGTILLNVDLDKMQKYLNPNKLKLISKGIDSVKSRVLNLNEKFPNLTKDIMFNAIKSEFLKYHNVGQDEYDEIYLDDENNNTNDKIKELYQYYNSWEWKYGECPEFTNSLCHKFTWGLVDLSLRVEKGKIQEAKIYSDTLIPEFVDIYNEYLKTCFEKYSYDKNGLNKLFDNSFSILNNNKDYEIFVEEMKEILIPQL